MNPNISEVKIGINSIVGIHGYTLTDAVASDMGLEKETRGVLVIGIVKDSTAEKAGLRAGTIPAEFGGVKGMLGGDIIIGIEDKAITRMEDLIEYLKLYHISGAQIKFRIIRDQKLTNITLNC